MTCFVRTTVLVTGLAASPLLTAAMDDQAAFRGETSVNVVEVPVRVVDRATGEPVTGLVAGDFEVYENGLAQPITNFAELWRNEDDAGSFAGSGAEAAAEASDDLRTRTVEVVYLLDLYLMNREGRSRAVDGLRSIYRDGVPDGQSISLVVYNGELETLADRTDDRTELLDALDEAALVETRGNQQSVAFSDELIDTSVSGERDQAYYERRRRNREFIGELERRVQRVGNAAMATMARYAAVDGRKVLVLFTPGHPRTGWVPEYSAVDFVNAAAEYPVHDLWHELALEAADLGFTLYTVDSSGLRVSFGSDVETGITDTLDESFDQGSLFRERDAPGEEPAVIGASDFAFDPGGETQSLGSWLERTRRTMLILAATATGGDALFAQDVGPAVESINRALGHHYSIAYVAGHSGDGKTYSIDVRLPAHPDYRVVHRAGYVDQPAAVRSGLRLRSAMLFGADANPLGVRVEIGEVDSRFRLGAAGSKRVEVPLHLKIPYGRLEMIERGDLYWSKVWITLFAEDAAGNQSPLASHEQVITVAANRYQEAVAKGYFSFHTGVEIEGGLQKVFVGVQEELSGRTSIMPLVLDH
ncbi:MAG: VWA domain-containing protein [Thermoanaerobaculales bacterium]|jgi:VWFA-related protein|nr:VWA domain-containing protein [Thermoanaerobaculales bacterium]